MTTEYAWTAEQIAQLTPGCTIGGHEVSSRALPDDGYHRVWLRDYDRKAVVVEHYDPATLLPPSLATLNRMAVESFGEGASVEEAGDGSLCAWSAVDGDDGHTLVARFYGANAARECARWLAARGR